MSEPNQPSQGSFPPPPPAPSAQPAGSAPLPPAPEQPAAQPAVQPQPESAHRFGSPDTNSELPQGSYAPVAEKKPNALMDALTAQWTTFRHITRGSFEAATGEAVQLKFFWIINFVLVSFAYALAGTNLINGILGVSEHALKAKAGVYSSYIPDLTLSAGSWFGHFIGIFFIILVLLLARVGLMMATLAHLKVNFTALANIYASTLSAHILVGLVGGILMFIPLKFAVGFALLLIFIGAHVVGVLSEISLFNAARAYSPQRSPLVPYLGYLKAWYLLAFIGLYIYLRLGFDAVSGVLQTLLAGFLG